MSMHKWLAIRRKQKPKVHIIVSGNHFENWEGEKNVIPTRETFRAATESIVCLLFRMCVSVQLAMGFHDFILLFDAFTRV